MKLPLNFRTYWCQQVFLWYDCVDIHKQPAFDHPLLKNHKIQYAVMQYYAPTAGTIKGGHGIFNVWNPSLNTSSDFSLTQIWVVAGNGSNVNTMEAGWQKYPARTGDNHTHFFIYWTRDSYNQTGCYDLYCACFMQSNKQMTIGAPLNVSTYNGKQVEVEILIDKDNSSGKWWLYVNNQTVGYWPPSIFTALANGADNVQWGGEIYENSGSGGQHTNTKMGSGHFPGDTTKKSPINNGKVCQDKQITCF